MGRLRVIGLCRVEVVLVDLQECSYLIIRTEGCPSRRKYCAVSIKGGYAATPSRECGGATLLIAAGERIISGCSVGLDILWPGYAGREPSGIYSVCLPSTRPVLEGVAWPPPLPALLQRFVVNSPCLKNFIVSAPDVSRTWRRRANFVQCWKVALPMAVSRAKSLQKDTIALPDQRILVCVKAISPTETIRHAILPPVNC